jgi:hypothetical protein
MSNRNFKYNYDRDFFETIDTPQKAYWLGMLTADGNIYNNRLKDNKSTAVGVRLRLKNSDREHLVKFNRDMKSNKLIEEIRNTGYKSGFTNNINNTISMLNFSSIKMWNDLHDKGLEDNKQTREKPYLGMKENLIKFYILGLWDGDGSISIDRNNKCNWEFVGSKEMTTWMREYLQNKLSITFMKESTDHRTSKLFRLRTNSKKNINLISKFLYSDKVVYLDRKYDKTNEFLAGNGFEGV